ncbi:MAG: hypothetical protein AMS24_01535 [Chlamydiae bacterium SM23_39]|nr:MAG: hypothetical protein AMS24_01535 [Chlamydiae bacterium SM23_39]
MNYKLISKTLGTYLFYFSLILFIPLGVSLYYQFLSSPADHLQPHSSLAFLETIVISLLLSLLFFYLGKDAKKNISRRESILLVGLIWIVTAIVGSLPFYFSKTLENPIDAYFETMSGLTTTGATCIHPKAYDPITNKEIMIKETNIHVTEKTYSFYGTIKPIIDKKTGKVLYSGVEAVGKGILFWRSFIQWLGGMGIVVLFLAILPTLTVGGKFLYQMEVPGPTKDTLVPRIKDTSSILWKLYLFFTILEIYLLVWTNPKIKLFDAFCITFSNLSTGGFTVTNESIGAYNNLNTELVCMFFMLIGSTNFALYFQLIKRKLYRIYEPDYLFFLLITLSGVIIISLTIVGHQRVLLDGATETYTLGTALRDGAFQSMSAQTSTGFITTNYDLWPFFPQLMLLIFMLVGGMAGSTAGGIKTSRIYILVKIVIHKIKNIFRPHDIRQLKIGKQEISSTTATTVLVFFVIAIFFAVLGILLLTLDGVDPESSVAVIASSQNNVGLCFRAAGPTQSFTFLSNTSKIITTFWMLLGRLEFFALLLLFVPSFWKVER